MTKPASTAAPVGPVVPFLWTVVVSLPKTPPQPTRGPWRWPLRGAAVVETRVVFAERLDAQLLAGADLVVADADDLPTHALLRAAHDAGASVLVLADAEPESHPRWRQLDRRGDPEVLQRAAQVVEQLVRERVALALLAWWRARLLELLSTSLASLDAIIAPSPGVPDRVPLATVEHAHVTAVHGLWLAQRTKVREVIDTSWRRLDRILSTIPEGLARALTPVEPGLDVPAQVAATLERLRAIAAERAPLPPRVGEPVALAQVRREAARAAWRVHQNWEQAARDLRIGAAQLRRVVRSPRSES